ncbi:NADH-quinone oxidoreductase subunit N [Chromobacterium alkanivorans]|uniref:NADH-quinone oxidoreductase subunit NuoN n=1 Tax=Chromobacterium TaxID=535 RepID=UPI0006539493|nr:MULTISPECIES: NADH-quinone oxidoreductase subunit NuoN [Chromobacterium]KMN82581.1 NADH:ubiquinone oxidoreductase subunit N [Chromobacterium sp. LK11]MBN3005926.1 NADH-quinone oxidoreductase subunit NuoN [Chromobacterium alkanivorans]MCS3802423.1 NADH-quinone oxidoreductase subunit N [Chromobacterium alkanivorans]MCS3816750.1 NADH-quinone oxidoreductase subunit N [Chromobacterium alkanivorans]MCS3871789.1 NADH-quinone oxidoreductase subunit N [Chromobacterium alkanivorans]
MNWADLNLIPAIPEMFLAGAILFVLMADLFVSDEKRGITLGLTLLSLLGAAVAQVMTFTAQPVVTFSGMFVADPMGGVVKLAMYAVTAIVLIYSRQYTADRQLFKGEYFSLALFALLGMNLMVSASHFLTLYMGLELLSLALYSLIALQRDSVQATEAAMKYFVLGALASGLLLYGISMVYGATGSLELATVAKSIAAHKANDVLLVFGLVFIVAGLSFKLGAVPFHMWVPDVYHGAPTSVTLMVGAAPKLAAFVFTLRILAQGLDALVADWQQMLVIVAALSMAIGNITAIVQTNIKRMLAYSTISHMGFLLLGVLAGTKVGYSAALFYALSYVLMSLVSFGMLLALSRAGFECEKVDDLKGLNSRNSWYALLMLLTMFSMAGIPPLVGFYAKFAVIKAIVDIGMIKLAIFAVLMSVIGAFYYLRVVKAMYFDDAEDRSDIVVRGDMKLVLSLNALALLFIGLLPERAMELCLQVVRQSLTVI